MSQEAENRSPAESTELDNLESTSSRVQPIDFHGGPMVSALPLVFFVAWAVVQSGIMGIGDPEGLVVGACSLYFPYRAARRLLHAAGPCR